MDGLEWMKKWTKVDEKVDKSGWRIKIVADGGYTHAQLSDKSGCPVEPFVPAAESGP